MILPAVLVVLTLHEYAHGLAAYALGDKTAKASGRLTLNPFAHIDIVGFICMLVAGIGWAKPVPVVPYYFKIKNKKLGMAITAIAGPLANLLVAFVCLAIYVYILICHTNSEVLIAVAEFMGITAYVSTGLMLFNLIPIPPLDGSKILFLFLPDNAVTFLYKYEQYIKAGFLLLLLTDQFTKHSILSVFLTNAIDYVIDSILEFLLIIFNLVLKLG